MCRAMWLLVEGTPSLPPPPGATSIAVQLQPDPRAFPPQPTAWCTPLTSWPVEEGDREERGAVPGTLLNLLKMEWERRHVTHSACRTGFPGGRQGRKGHKKGREDGGQEETGRHLPGGLRSNEKNKDNMKSAHKGLSLAD